MTNHIIVSTLETEHVTRLLHLQIAVFWFKFLEALKPAETAGNLEIILPIYWCTTVSLSLPTPPAAPLCIFPTFKHPTLMNMAVADSRNAKPLDRPDNTDIDDKKSPQMRMTLMVACGSIINGHIPALPHGGVHWHTLLPPTPSLSLPPSPSSICICPEIIIIIVSYIEE